MRVNIKEHHGYYAIREDSAHGAAHKKHLGHAQVDHQGGTHGESIRMAHMGRSLGKLYWAYDQGGHMVSLCEDAIKSTHMG